MTEDHKDEDWYNSPPDWLDEVRDETWVTKVAMTPERDLRGHRIALTYHAMARGMYDYIYGPGTAAGAVVPPWTSGNTPRDANWFAFATWATATLNRDIENDRPPVRSERLMPLGFRRELTPKVLAIKSVNGQHLNQLLTWYQRLVFLNTALAYVHLIERGDEVAFAEEGKPVIDQIWANKVIKLATWDDKCAISEKRHLYPVAMAFDYYRKARLVTKALPKDPGSDADRYLRTLRSRLILLANLILIAVEQDVVDPGVKRVITNVPDWAAAVLGTRVATLAERATGIPRQIAGLRVPVRLRPAQDVATELWARLLTDQVFVLALPSETLRLGRDIPPVSLGLPYFPRELRGLDRLPDIQDQSVLPTSGYPGELDKHEQDNRNLRDLVASFDRSQGDGRGTAATDWRRYPDRLNWAVSLVRSRQQQPSVFWPPYRDEDARRIVKGDLPVRTGDPVDFEVLAPLQGFTYGARAAKGGTP